MRLFLSLIAFAVTSFALEGEVRTLKEAVATGDPERINSALILLHRVIIQHENIPWVSKDKAAPELMRLRHEVMAALGPIEGDLVGLAGRDDAIAQNAITILGFSNGSSLVYETLKHRVETADSADVALFSLFQMSRADAEVRKVAARRMANYKERSESQTAVALLNLAAVWAVPEAMPTCLEILKSDREVELKVVAAKALMKLGPAATEALPELLRCVEQFRAQGADFRYINTVERAIRVISAQAQLSAPTPLSGPTPAPTTTVPKGPHVDSPSPALGVAQASESAAAHRGRAWPWILGMVAVAVIVLLKWKRRV